QDESKLFRHRIVDWCGGTMDALENGTRRLDDNSLVDAYCSKLHEAGSLDYFMSQARTLDDDSGLLAKDSYTVSPRAVTTEQRADIEQSLTTLLSGVEDPWQATSLVHGLWSIQSDAVSPDWAALNALLPSQRSQLRIAVEAGVACGMIGGCGSQNPWTFFY